jgi:hypothetical protein
LWHIFSRLKLWSQQRPLDTQWHLNIITSWWRILYCKQPLKISVARQRPINTRRMVCSASPYYATVEGLLGEMFPAGSCDPMMERLLRKIFSTNSAPSYKRVFTTTPNLSQCMGVALSYPVLGKNKYRNPVLEVGESQNWDIEMCLFFSRNTGPRKSVLARLASTVNYRPILSSEKATHCLKIIFIGEKILGRGSKMLDWHQDRLADWSSVVRYPWLWFESWTREWMPWRGITKFVNFRLVLSSRRVRSNNKPAEV